MPHSLRNILSVQNNFITAVSHS